jgi:hypothetical protein
MMSVDEETLCVYKKQNNEINPFEAIGSVFFVYGNDGWDVIADYSVSLEEQMDIINKFIEEKQSKYI